MSGGLKYGEALRMLKNEGMTTDLRLSLTTEAVCLHLKLRDVSKFERLVISLSQISPG